MSSRKPLVCGNWKMFKTVAESSEFCGELCRTLKHPEGVDVAICPPFTAMQEVGKLLDGSPIDVGAQNIAWEKEGALTGEISPLMLKELGCTLAIVGHSERRALMGETNQMVSRKLVNAFQFHLTPILCIGETLEEREAGSTEAVIRDQLQGSLKDVRSASLGVEKMVVAYEPIWAIGTGKNATPEIAQEVHHFIREFIKKEFGEAPAREIRILYGGSVKPKNAHDLISKPDIDGALVGGASLDVRSFIQIIEAAVQTTERV
jgi:triosephosphate isomerase (TIM)